MLRILGRWLLYTVVGLVLVALLLASGDFHGADEPKGSWRSILLSIAAVIAGLAGGAILASHGAGGSIGDYWPAGSAVAWLLAGGLVLGAWFSIAADITREAGGQSKSG